MLTAADHIHHNPPALKAEDVTIMDGTITGFTPLAGANSALELYLLIDDNANYAFGSKLQELEKFVSSQPAATAVGIAYIHEGTLEIVESPTTDHARAARALRTLRAVRRPTPIAKFPI